MQEFLLDTEENSASGATREITAYQDLGCLNATKYIYQFHEPIQQEIVKYFFECEIKIVHFAKYVRNAKDLLKIRKLDEFQADFIVSGFTATVYFDKRAERPARLLLKAFDRRLYDAGCGSVTYLAARQPQCDRCPMRHVKACGSSKGEFAPS